MTEREGGKGKRVDKKNTAGLGKWSRYVYRKAEDIVDSRILNDRIVLFSFYCLNGDYFLFLSELIYFLFHVKQSVARIDREGFYCPVIVYAIAWKKYC